MIKIDAQITQKHEKLAKLKEKVDSIKGFSEREDLEKLVKEKETELSNIRGEMAKLKNISP